MSVTAAHSFRHHVNRMSTLQAEVAPCFQNGIIDYAGLAQLGSRSGFDFTADEARKVLAAPGELSAFEREMVAEGMLDCRSRIAALQR
ncbi:MAG TPA: hypothetical protein VF774_18375 [Pseudoduganella sp.]